MKIKTYIADNVQEALYKVKSEMGRDAIILQTRKIKTGGIFGLFGKTKVEVIAACELEPKKSIESSINLTLPRINMKASESMFNYAENINPTKSSIEENQIEGIKNELQEVKRLIKEIYDNKDSSSKTGLKKAKSFQTLIERLTSMEVKDEVIKVIIDNIKKDSSGNNSKILMENAKNEIIKMINQPEPIKIKETPAKIALIGPTGVGKTTTIAKLAAHYSLNEGKKVALITSDTYRVGAVSQLKTYGELLEIPVEILYEPKEASNILKKLNGYEIIFYDTLGTSPKNKIFLKKIKNIIEAIEPTELHMVISATTKTSEVENILENYKDLNYNKLLFTKIDETNIYGLILNAVYYSKCCLSYITTGQNVPDDIEVASPVKIANLLLGESDNA
ncbi:flagellar biosynthesis protein FlhF [Thermovenabulum gondwanense]|uniref:Flagellar biosynthesis protein FlhF n=1 Tax=Thermovenabulum gondwanense TaxID=520767 RepID=A0A161Q9V8_9FIRM|nr:flagellar biosynthesis protein FlhF [Thermovenabulum gondwanense]KYO64568.1 Flagellar biosynthesis protein FlhF [Thermovenabulum gondwanense]